MGRRLAADIETDGLLDELTTLHSLVIKDIDSKEVWSCTDSCKEPNHDYVSLADGIALLEQADLVIFHNGLCFDLPALQKLYPNIKLQVNRIHDSLVLSTLIFADIKQRDYGPANRGAYPKTLIGKHGLEAWGYRLGKHKGNFGKDTDWSEWSREMQDYCEQDVEVTEALYAALQPHKWSAESIELEHDFREKIAWQERCGFLFDEQAAQVLHAELRDRLLSIERGLQEIFPARIEELKSPAYWTLTHTPSGKRIKANSKKDCNRERMEMGWRPKDCTWKRGPNRTKEHPFNPGSRDQIVERLKEKYQWEPSVFTENGNPKVDEDVLSTLPYAEAKPLLEYLMVNKRISQLATGENGWLKMIRDDGRIHGRVNTNGAVTGRCTHSTPNVAQVPSGKVEYGPECRALFLAEEGWKLVGCDADGLELRCLAHFMAKYDGGKYVQAILSGDKSKGTDIHSMNAKALGLDPTQVYELIPGSKQTGRDIAKTFIYAFIYGAGDWKIGLTVYGPVDDAKIKEVARADIKRWRKTAAWMKRSYAKKDKIATPRDVALTLLGQDLKANFLKGLPALKKLSDAVAAAIEDRGYLRGLDGRILRIRSPHAALNTLLQSAGALIMKKALLIFAARAESNGWRIARDLDDAQAVIRFVANVHDEAQMEAKPDIAESVGQLFAESITAAGEHFQFRCPLAGAYDVGANWRDTH